MSTLKVNQGVDVDLLTDTVTEGTLGTGRVGPVKVAYGSATAITLVDATHGLPVVGQGTAGTASGGVVSIQGVASGTAVPISGAVTGSGTFAATQSGTWTVQPGNTANTTAWKVDGSAVTQPVSGTVTVTGPIKASLTNNQSITCTFTSLTNTSARGSLAIDNTSNQDFDAMVSVKVKTNGSGTSASGVVQVYAYGSADGGTNYTDGVSGTDASVTITSPAILRLIGIIYANANAVTRIGGPFSVASGFGYLPGKWGIVISNQTGATLDASIGNAWYERFSIQKA